MSNNMTTTSSSGSGDGEVDEQGVKVELGFDETTRREIKTLAEATENEGSKHYILRGIDTLFFSGRMG